MNYNDFPILNDETYTLMRDKFNSAKNFDRRETTHKICFCLNECVESFRNVKNEFNKNITNALKYADGEIKKTLSTLNETFEVEINSNVAREFKLFKFLHLLVDATHELIIWNSGEDKEYYKKVSSTCLNSTIDALKKIIEALEKSNVQLYKFM